MHVMRIKKVIGEIIVLMSSFKFLVQRFKKNNNCAVCLVCWTFEEANWKCCRSAIPSLCALTNQREDILFFLGLWNAEPNAIVMADGMFSRGFHHHLYV